MRKQHFDRRQNRPTGLLALGVAGCTDKILLLANDGGGQAFLGKHVEFIQGANMKGGKATAFVYRDYVCHLPTPDIPAMVRLIAGKLERPESASKVETDAAAAIPPGEPVNKSDE